MSQISGLTTINTVISAVLLDMGKEDKYDAMAEKIGQYAIWEYNQLFKGFTPNNISVIYCRLNNFRMMDLPDDYEDYIKIGMMVRGKVWTLTMNENLPLARMNDCGLEIRDIINDSVSPDAWSTYGGYYFADHFRHGNYVGGMFGMTGGFNRGYYRIDMERHRIQFDMGLPQGTEIVLEYKSSGIKTCGTTYIPRAFLDPLVKKCHWRINRYRPDVSATEKKMLEEDYNNSIKDLSIDQISFSISEMMDAMYSNNSYAPHR